MSSKGSKVNRPNVLGEYYRCKSKVKTDVRSTFAASLTIKLWNFYPQAREVVGNDPPPFPHTQNTCPPNLPLSMVISIPLPVPFPMAIAQ